MPKTSNEGPTYAGRVDVSSADTLVPEWVEPGANDTKPAEVSRETKADDKADDKAEHGRRPAPRKTSKS